MPFSVVKRLLVGLKDDILDFVYPQSCPICRKPLARDENQVCHECWGTMTILPNSFCPYCKSFFEDENSVDEHHCLYLSRPEDRLIPAVRSLGTFDDHYQTLIHRFKYGKNLPLGRRLAKRLGQSVSEMESFADYDLVVPVPLHRARYRERGFNQSEVLAEGVAESTGVSLATGALRRKKNTRDQTYLNALQRAENVKDAFAVKESDRIDGKTIILVDDVMTTGATLNECARTLLSAGAVDIFAATLAVVVD
jgi:ComF family protein